MDRIGDRISMWVIWIISKPYAIKVRLLSYDFQDTNSELFILFVPTFKQRFCLLKSDYIVLHLITAERDVQLTAIKHLEPRKSKDGRSGGSDQLLRVKVVRQNTDIYGH